jgi:acetyl esterase/lipase
MRSAVMALLSAVLVVFVSTSAVAAVNVVEGIAYIEGSANPKHKLDIYLPDGSQTAPVLFWVYGGGLTSGDRRDKDNTDVGMRFAAEGFVTVVISYRLSPEVAHPAHVEDVAKAFSWVVKNIARHRGDANRIFVSGHSAGAYLIGLLTTDTRYLQRENLSTNRMLAVIPISGFYYVDRVAPMPDRPRSVWGSNPDGWLQASPAQYVRKDAPPTLLIYADGDEDWRRKDNEDFKAAMKSAGHARVESHQIAGRSHMSILRRMPAANDETTALMLSYIKKTLGSL